MYDYKGFPVMSLMSNTTNSTALKKYVMGGWNKKQVNCRGELKKTLNANLKSLYYTNDTT